MILLSLILATMTVATTPSSLPSGADTPPAKQTESAIFMETAEQKNARMAWWRKAKFGMFIHWGVYSVPAGFYAGKPVDGIGEWIMYSANIPTSDYRNFAKTFNPVKYDPDAWVRTAKEAGMQYIVITSKHHDGFALFDSKASSWNVVQSSAYGKDLLRPLAAACRKYKMRLGFYYSQAQDWTNPGGGAYKAKWDPEQEGNFDDYLTRVALPQVNEILTNYGDISVLWFDTPANMTPERAARFFPILRQHPHLIINNRLGGNVLGDTETPEQFIPATGYPGRDWESCMTMNDTWGYKSNDTNWKSASSLVRNLVDITSKGGNYLLNVGPTSEGLIPEPSVERLAAVGAWMKVNHEAIYETSASPFRNLPWGRCTVKSKKGKTLLYLHVFDWPQNSKLVVPGLTSKVISAYLLHGRGRLPFANVADTVEVQVPAKSPDSISSTIVLEISGKPVVVTSTLSQAKDGTLTLAARDAVVHGSNLKYEADSVKDNLGFWTDTTDWAEWTATISQTGKFKVIAEVAAVTGGSQWEVGIGDQKLTVTSPQTGSYEKFEAFDAGVIEIPKSGKMTLTVRPIQQEWKPINLKSIRLIPAP